MRVSLTNSYEKAKEQVLQVIENRKEYVIIFLQTLAKMRSPEGEGIDVQEYVSKYLRKMGADKVDLFKPDENKLRNHPGFSHVPPDFGGRGIGEKPVVVGTFKGEGGGRSILFTGHMESATPRWELVNVKKWRFNPFSGVIKDGKMYGKSVRNMKAGNAAYIMALESIREAGIKLNGDVIICTNTDEDTGSNGSLEAVLRGYKADGGICPESSRMVIWTTQGGPLTFRVKVRGKVAMLPSGWKYRLSVSAIENGIKIYNAIKDFGDHRAQTKSHPLYVDYPSSVLTYIGVFRAGNWPQGVPLEAIIEGMITTVPGENPMEIKKEFEAFIKQRAETDQNMKDDLPDVEWYANWEACEVPTDHPIVTTTRRAFTEIMGKEPEIRGGVGGADAAKFTLYGETPMIQLGPNYDDELEENVILESYINLMKIFALTILKWCGVHPSHD